MIQLIFTLGGFFVGVFFFLFTLLRLFIRPDQIMIEIRFLMSIVE
jgi:hypothetical protein